MLRRYLGALLVVLQDPQPNDKSYRKLRRVGNDWKGGSMGFGINSYMSSGQGLEREMTIFDQQAGAFRRMTCCRYWMI